MYSNKVEKGLRLFLIFAAGMNLLIFLLLLLEQSTSIKIESRNVTNIEWQHPLPWYQPSRIFGQRKSQVSFDEAKFFIDKTLYKTFEVGDIAVLHTGEISGIVYRYEFASAKWELLSWAAGVYIVLGILIFFPVLRDFSLTWLFSFYGIMKFLYLTVGG